MKIVLNHSNALKSNIQPLKSMDIELSREHQALILNQMRSTIYKYHLRTAVQEYLCNARDAHREVKQTSKKIEVQAPTYMDLTLRIKDYGPGISPERMDKIFRYMGNSSKRDSNNETGGFGAGSKIGLAICDSFQIFTVVDGTQYNYLVTVANKPQGEIILQKEFKTAEPNGTTIVLPIKNQDVEKCVSAINRCIYFWKEEERPTVSNMVADAGFWSYSHNDLGVDDDKMSSMLITTENFPRYVIDDHYAKSLFLIDGIPYQTKGLDIKELSDLETKVKGKIVFLFKNGVLKLALNREEIQLEPNRNIIKNLSAKALKTILSEISGAFKGINDVKSFFQAFQTINQKYSIQNQSFKGFTFDINGKIYDGGLQYLKIEKKGEKVSRRRRFHERQTINVADIGRIYYDDGSESKAMVGRRVNYKQQLTNQKLVIVSKSKVEADSNFTEKQVNDAFNEVIKMLEIPSVSTLEVPKIEKAKDEKERKQKTMVCLHTLTQNGKYSNTFTLEQLEVASNKYVYILYSEYQKGDNSLRTQASNMSDYFESNLTFIAISNEDLKKVQGTDEIENFTHYSDWLKNYSPSNKDLEVFISNKADNRKSVLKLKKILSKSDGKFKNKLLNEMVEVYSKLKEKTVDESRYYGHKYYLNLPSDIAKLCQKDSKAQSFLNDDKELGTILKNMPLLGAIDLNEIGTAEATDLLEYINKKNFK